MRTQRRGRETVDHIEQHASAVKKLLSATNGAKVWERMKGLMERGETRVVGGGGAITTETLIREIETKKISSSYVCVCACV